MRERQVSSTSHPIPILMIQSSDHISGLTGATPVVTLSKDGGAFATAAGAVTEIGNGWYALAGNATDRNTVGELLIHVTAVNADPYDDKYEIVPWNPYDGIALGLSALVVRSATAAAGAAGSITLDAGASATNSFYNMMWIFIISGTGAGQVRMCASYNGTTKIAVVNPVWSINPDNTSVFVILPSASLQAEQFGAQAKNTDIPNSVWDTVLTSATHNVVNSAGRDLRTITSIFSVVGNVASATVSTAVLDINASAVSNIYNYDLLTIISGTGQGQTATITAYDGTTKTATVTPNWVVTPDSTSVYGVIPGSQITSTSVAAIKLKTDKLTFDGSNFVYANAQALPSPAPSGYGGGGGGGTGGTVVYAFGPPVESVAVADRATYTRSAK